eukprot:CAMPEP_0172585788 /NCGR_PEP_ID=MMETSP1068-20121228/5176_1 /TAXON_ID=35684 /ORGANISM="Pseudopedinella elastica, Strain CCMP716" /LENGTH=73 /DNA_ID=CAMNT_0013380359 /DNA_START=48 /DNA_END=269 /DNA_ORIENTATION=+
MAHRRSIGIAALSIEDPQQRLGGLNPRIYKGGTRWLRGLFWGLLSPQALEGEVGCAVVEKEIERLGIIHDSTK